MGQWLVVTDMNASLDPALRDIINVTCTVPTDQVGYRTGIPGFPTYTQGCST